MTDKRSEAEILEDLRDVENDLSPENLSCDGMLNRRQTQRRLATLNDRKAWLIVELGREPTDEELSP